MSSTAPVTGPLLTWLAVGVGSGMGSVTSDIVSGNDVSLRNAAISAGEGALMSPIPSGPSMHGVDTLQQMPHMHTRSLRGLTDMSKKNSKRLLTNAAVGNSAGSVADIFAEKLKDHPAKFPNVDVDGGSYVR